MTAAGGLPMSHFMGRSVGWGLNPALWVDQPDQLEGTMPHFEGYKL